MNINLYGRLYNLMMDNCYNNTIKCVNIFAYIIIYIFANHCQNSPHCFHCKSYFLNTLISHIFTWRVAALRLELGQLEKEPPVAFGLGFTTPRLEGRDMYMLGLIPYAGARYYTGYGNGVHVQSMLHESVAVCQIDFKWFEKQKPSEDFYLTNVDSIWTEQRAKKL